MIEVQSYFKEQTHGAMSTRVQHTECLKEKEWSWNHYKLMEPEMLLERWVGLGGMGENVNKEVSRD